MPEGISLQLANVLLAKTQILKIQGSACLNHNVVEPLSMKNLTFMKVGLNL